MTVETNSNITGVGSSASGGALGPYVDLAALNAAQPAASNAGKTAMVGAAAPYATYACDGKNWLQISSAANRIALLKQAIDVPGSRRHVDQPWNPPPAHQVSTLYAAGACVVNAGNIYYNASAAAQTSGAASPPTGTSFNTVVDGGISWQYVGPTFTADAAAPTLVNNGTTAPTSKKLFRNSGSTLAGSTNIITNNGWFALGGGADNGGGNGLGSSTSSTDGWVSFDTDAPVIWVAKYGAGVVASSMVSVDGRYIQPGTFIENVSFAATQYIQITFPAGYKRRNVTFYYQMPGIYVGIRGVYVDTPYSVWAPSTLEFTGPRVAAIGDSTYQQPAFSGMNADVQQIRKALGILGINNVLINAAGGSGISAGAKYSTRVSAVVAFDPDWIHVHTSVNDGGFSLATLTADLTAFVSGVRSSASGMKPLITVSGDVSRVTSGSETTLEANVRQACATINDPKLIFIPCSGDTAGPWVTGTGRVSAQDGGGNADRIFSSDGVHPLQSGIDYYALRTATVFRSIINAL